MMPFGVMPLGWRRIRVGVIGVCIGLGLLGCTHLSKRLAIQTMSDMIAAGQPVYERETDLELGTQALAANVKLLEGFLESAPEELGLLLQASQGFAAYAYTVAERRLAESHRDATSNIDGLTRRAGSLYRRGLQYGLRWLSRYHADWRQATALEPDVLKAHLEQLPSEAVPALFWTAFCWGGTLNMTRDALETLAALPRFEALLMRLVQLDETYFYGAPHLLLAVHFASRAP